LVANGKDLISEVDFDRIKAAYNDYQDRIRKNFGNADFTYGVRGTAASWISSSTEEKLMSGGAEQIVTSLNAQTLEVIGVIPKY
jgi:hypothetical protein